MNAVTFIHDSAATYHATKALSKSSMDELLKCPALFKQTLDTMGGDHAATPAMILGSVFHSMTLEPEFLDAEYAPRQNAGNTKAAKEEAAKAAENGITLVQRETWATCEAMRDAANAHPLLKAAKAAEDWQAEVSIYWQEREMIPCKARVDALATIPGFGLCAIDLKSTTDASPDAISRHLYDYGYHRQAAWYTHALRLVGFEPRQFVFLFVEKTAPYLSTAVSVSDGAMCLALEEIRSALKRYEDCAASGTWPGYTQDIITEIDLPAWAYRR